VPNGLALCKIHHAAFDMNILGIRPDHVVEIRTDVLEERDGPCCATAFKIFTAGDSSCCRADRTTDPILTDSRNATHCSAPPDSALAPQRDDAISVRPV